MECNEIRGRCALHRGYGITGAAEAQQGGISVDVDFLYTFLMPDSSLRYAVGT